MVCKDEFRKFQKYCCPFSYGMRGKRSIYGCPCCRDESFTAFKRTARRWARRMLQLETKKAIDEYDD